MVHFFYFAYLWNCEDFQSVIPKLYFHIFLLGYVVSIEHIDYDFIFKYSIAFCIALFKIFELQKQPCNAPWIFKSLTGQMQKKKK